MSLTGHNEAKDSWKYKYLLKMKSYVKLHFFLGRHFGASELPYVVELIESNNFHVGRFPLFLIFKPFLAIFQKVASLGRHYGRPLGTFEVPYIVELFEVNK
jgi:hypothetical protein